MNTLKRLAKQIVIVTWAYERVWAIISTFKKNFLGIRQLEWKGDPNGNPRVLFVAPAQMPVPPAGWGAVELVISQQIDYFVQRGARVVLLNSSNPIDWIRAFVSKHTVVICHYDEFAPRVTQLARLLKIPTIGTTHYAYAQSPEKWNGAYANLTKSFGKYDFFVALNPQIEVVLRKLIPEPTYLTIPNGVNVRSFRFVEHGSGLIRLGKVETRKQQFELALGLPADFPITFVGQVSDPRINDLDEVRRAKFVGAWNREEVEDRLTKFSKLVLLSNGEADALVLYEAQAAGLNVTTNTISLGSQDISLRWIQVIENQPDLGNLDADTIKALSQSYPNRIKIRKYALDNYSATSSAERWFNLATMASKRPKADYLDETKNEF